ncbi:HIT-like protein [Gymnopus androsaceus JB14]|uniref:HIT-like protein n=1 Tax=Gymnopus androsaceus JB14 TaxID=1447944 RepID=A0A6A4GBZ6_9AGAR|nr:HIT-like protein [Gymnopus androsaceus JB14]
MSFARLLSRLFFSGTPSGSPPLIEQSKYDSNCVFCDVSVQNGFDVLWEDEKLIAFRDQIPASKYHIQVIPKEHIRSIRQLRKSDVQMLKDMVKLAHQLLDELAIAGPTRKMGFHIPPFNSINHLHLHVQALPYKTLAKKAKYPVANGFKSYIKGFSWFVEAKQAISILQDDRTVGVFPC